MFPASNRAELEQALSDVSVQASVAAYAAHAGDNVVLRSEMKSLVARLKEINRILDHLDTMNEVRV